jgi:transcriptional regulator with XRE-family HTH domain
MKNQHKEFDNKIIKYAYSKLNHLKNYTLKDVAEHSGVSYVHLNRLINDHKKSSDKINDKLCDLAEMTLTEKMKALSGQNFYASIAQEPSAEYEKRPDLNFCYEEAEKKNNIIDRLLDDTKTKSRQLDDLIKELQKLTDTIVKLSS